VDKIIYSAQCRPKAASKALVCAAIKEFVVVNNLQNLFRKNYAVNDRKYLPL